MGFKLTFRINEKLIKAANEHSEKKGNSDLAFSQIFFQVIRNEKIEKEQPLSPTVNSLQGILKGEGVFEPIE